MNNCRCGKVISFTGCAPRETVLCDCGRGHVVPDAKLPVKYGNWLIDYNPPPIPVRNCDWQFWHKDFDGAEDAGDNRCGHSSTLIDCMNEIDDYEDDRFDCQCSAADPCGCMRAGSCEWRDDQRARLASRSAHLKATGGDQ